MSPAKQFYLLLNFLFYNNPKEQHDCLNYFKTLDHFQEKFSDYLNQKRFSIKKKALLTSIFQQFDIETIKKQYHQQAKQVVLKHYHF